MAEMPEYQPLLPGLQQGAGDLFVAGTGATVASIEHNRFLAEAVALAQTLPAAPHVINLCDDRYHFALAFAAALIRGAVSLFPQDRLASTCHEIARDYPGAACLTDIPVDGLRLPTHRIAPDSDAAALPATMPLVAADRIAFIAFTSGSTGRPRPHPKRWGDLLGCAFAASRRFGFDRETGIVATVPPQHMYGLELSILVPFAIGARVSATRPLFPADIRDALTRMPGRRVLVTTPVHLAACIKAGLDWPRTAQVISATAPLPEALARDVEAAWGTRVLEIYGSTESGSIASRRTLDGPDWRWYDSVRPHRHDERVGVTADFIHGAVPLADVLALSPGGGFRLLGRAADMIKVGGKRASLADLNLKLKEIDGVIDGVFVAPEAADDGVGRLAVVAVAPGLDRRSIVAGLAGRIDPAFYPRRVLLVERLPRNAAGKLPRAALLELLAQSADKAS